ncbi:hypothetical protein F1641_06260 [Quadrisphaera sp. INWT6]|nr:hypothetical protein [Quadrisphaera sp. INWT6]
MAPSHPSAPVPAPVAPPQARVGVLPAPARAVPADAPTADPLPSRRSRRAELLRDLPVDAPVQRTAPAAPAAPGEGPAEGPLPTRRSRRAALVPVDAPPPASAPALPGSRRALREQAAGAPPAPRTAPAAAPLGAVRVPAPARSAAPTAPTATDADVLARLEALLAEPTGSWEAAPVARLEPAVAPAPAPLSTLDLRTDPELPATGWARREQPATAPEAAAAAPDASDALAVPAAAPRPAREVLPSPVAAPQLLAEAVEEALAPGAAVFTPRRGRASHRLPKRARAALPQVAVVGVLGIASLVAPLVGTHLQAQADTGGSTASSASADAGASTYQAVAAASAAAAADLLTGRASEALSRTSARDDAALQATAERAQAVKVEQDRIAAEAAAKAEQDRAAAEAAAKAAEEHRQAVTSLVGDCSGQRPDTAGTKNGRLQDSQMCDLWVGNHKLRSDAALAFAELSLAYREHFGSDIVITDSYRSYAAQVSVRRSKPRLAAVPGTSEHGWGLAVDLGGGVQNSDEHYDWLIENAPKYGWDHPAWARKGGGGPYEPWHWEYVAGE